MNSIQNHTKNSKFYMFHEFTNTFIGGIGTYINITVLARLIHLLQMTLSGSKIVKNHETTI